MTKLIIRLALAAALATPLALTATPASAGETCFLGYCFNNAPRSKGGDCQILCPLGPDVHTRKPNSRYVPPSTEWPMPKIRKPRTFEQAFPQTKKGKRSSGGCGFYDPWPC